jgi:hypothetical protein
MVAMLGLTLAMGAAAMLGAADSSTVTGHLRDGFCYTTMGAQGAGHHNCAVKCAKAGIPVMLVDDKTDKGYILLPSKDDSPLPNDVLKKLEDEVTITGHEFSKNGVNYLQVESVK